MAKTGNVEASIILLEGDATVDAMDKVRLLEIDRRSYLHSILKSDVTFMDKSSLVMSMNLEAVYGTTFSLIFSFLEWYECAPHSRSERSSQAGCISDR